MRMTTRSSRYESIGASVSFTDALDDDDDEQDIYADASSPESSSAAAIPTHHHTQFLDLTNGQGGEPEAETAPTPPPVAAAAAPSPSARRITVDPSTPGKVVEPGQEHTGRWTREEHEAFLTALQLYGKEWKKVAAKVKTRTVVQTRTHAQKYFQKLSKVMADGGGKDSTTTKVVEMGIDSKSKSTKAQQQQQQQQPKSKKKSQMTTRLARQASTSTQQAAHVMANLSSSSKTTTTKYAAVASSTPTPHGFSSPATNKVAWNTSTGLGIKAPDPQDAFRRGKFPEPSPAACGKRKVAEIAAARMLAGVMAGTTTNGGSSGENKRFRSSSGQGDETPPPQDDEEMAAAAAAAAAAHGFNMSSSSNPKGLSSLQIVNPESLGISGGELKRFGEASPTTPWEGQLKALVSIDKVDDLMEDSEHGALDKVSSSLPQMVDSSSITEGSHPHPVLGPDMYNRSPLHRAVCEANVANVNSCLSESTLRQADQGGFYPIHSASALSMTTLGAGAQVVRLLLSSGADAGCADANGNTPLHWAARAGDEDVAHLLVMNHGPLDAKNNRGETPLHWALRAGRVGMRVVGVLTRNGARPTIFNKDFKRPMDVAALGFDGDEEKKKNLPRTSSSSELSRSTRRGKSEQRKAEAAKFDATRETRSNLFLLSDKSRSLVLHHPECLEHIPKSEADWEVPDRINSILRRIVPQSSETASGIMQYEVTVSSDFEKANLELLSRVHSKDYLLFVNDLSKELERKQKQALSEAGSDASEEFSESASAKGVPFTPMVQRSMMKVDVPKRGENSDTSFSAGSLRAARRAAGAVQHAVDRVLVGRNRNAFCVVRPPGHHAGVQGLLAGGESCGFCIFNNVAAGAMHAISDERLICERCAIVDIDVHHGNGTEEIVKKCSDPSRLLFFSIHLYDNDKRKGNPYKFYPGTGDEDDVAHNIINVPILPLWKERNSSSRSQKPSNINTRRKAKEKAAAASSIPPPPPFGDGTSTPPMLPFSDSPRDSMHGDESSDVAAPEPSPVSFGRSSDTESESRFASSGNNGVGQPSPRVLTGSGRLAYRRAIQHRLIPALRAFNPDLILISAGFDAAKGDVGNAKHMVGGKEKSGLDLSPADYGWATRKILEVADMCCQGRVVSVLEGGYGRTPTMDQIDHALDKSVFSECAVRHLQAMIDPYDQEGRFSSQS